MKRICLITCYMGKLPQYFDYYVASCKENPDIDFVVINDSISESINDRNIQYLKMDLRELNAYATERLGVPIHLANAWKINELKPLFGVVFSDLLEDYDFWGWCDLDIIWGRLRHFLPDSLLTGYDVITTKTHWTAGHFTLLRNTGTCNRLFENYANVYTLLNDPAYYAFEECCHRWDGEQFTGEELARRQLPLSMYDLVKHAEARGELKALFRDVIREHPQLINYTYRDGVLTDHNSGEEFMYYHLITVKKIWRFYIPPYTHGNLIITPYGIRAESEDRGIWFLRRARSCYKGIRRSVKQQRPLDLVKKLVSRRNKLR